MAGFAFVRRIRRQTQVMLWARACQNTTALTFSMPRTVNATRLPLRAADLLPRGQAARGAGRGAPARFISLGAVKALQPHPHPGDLDGAAVENVVATGDRLGLRTGRHHERE